MVETKEKQPVKIHSLKTWPEYFEKVKEGLKTFELRKNDRDFNKNDFLCLEEWDPKSEQYTQKDLFCKITYILNGPSFGLSEGFCIMSIKLIPLFCSKKYPYSCRGDNEPCSVCGHLGKYHIFRNGMSFCTKCNE